jgi:hypothetical protein
MAQSFTTQDGITLINPGTYVSVSVKPGQGNIATAGVVTLIGEAEEGPGFLDEADLSEVAYSPSQYIQVLQKYGSGRLVDAFNSVISAANDPNIVGAATLIRVIKTNQSQKGSALLKGVSGDFASFQAIKAGVNSNLIKFKSDISQIETAPTTGLFTYTPSSSSVSFGIRVNGQALKSVSVPAKTDTIQPLVEDVAAGIMCKGGTVKEVLPVGQVLSAASLTTDLLLVSLPSGQLWANSPAVGDTAIIPNANEYSIGATASVIAGSGEVNAGVYIVQGVTNTSTSATLTLKKISTVGALTSASSASTTQKDLILVSQMEIKNMSGDRKLSTVGVGGQYQSVITGSEVTITAQAAWANQPSINDIVKVEATFAGIEAGFYQITASTSQTLKMVRLSNGSAGSSSSATISAPTEASEPFKVISPVVQGLGKTLCIEEQVSGTMAVIAKTSAGLSAGLANLQIVSASELKNQMTYSKDNSAETFVSGGDVILAVGCSEENATMVIGSDKIDFKVGSTVRFSATFKQFKTLNDLAAYISSQTNFSASLVSPRFSNVAPSSLDQGTFGISGLATHKNGRLKKDSADWLAQNSQSALIKPQLSVKSGLPATTETYQFLSGGSKGGTTSALIAAAIDAAEKLTTNFIVPLFSVDADEDIANGETESSSTYTIDAINAYTQAHILKMSSVKMRKNRIAVVSKKTSYSDAKDAAGELNSFRTYMCFESVKSVDASGNIVLFQPWMGAVVAAGMQAAAGYKGIVKKFANVSGTVMESGDFDSGNPGSTEDALKSGLLFMERVPTGGFRWVSDQSTYTIDNNFVYNSMQAVYLSDLMVLTLIERFDTLVVGKSVAQVSANAALSILEAEMFNFLRLRWIAPSSDAIKGFKNATARINGPVLEISVEIKLAGLIYFVPISLSISEVQQTA